jgi:hypothetical protein
LNGNGRAGSEIPDSEIFLGISMDPNSLSFLSADLEDPNSDTARNFKKIVWNIMKDAGKVVGNNFGWCTNSH